METPIFLPDLLGLDPHATLIAQVRDFAVIFLDAGGQIVSWNVGAQLLFGYEASEIIGQMGHVLFTPEDRQNGVPEAELEGARREGRAEDVRWHQKKDGTQFWASAVTTAFRDAAGQVRGFGKIARDETARKRAEDDLRRAQERSDLVARATHDAVWDWDVTTGEFGWNRNIETTFGYDFAARHPMEWWDARNHPDDRARVAAELAAVIESGGQFWQGEYRFARGDDSYTPVFTRCYVLRDGAGQATRVVGAMMDVSQRKELEASQQIFRQLADNSPDFMAMCDLDFKPLYGNPMVRQLLGTRPPEMAKNPRVEDYFFPEDVAFMMGEFFPRVIRDGQGITEIRLRHLQTGAAVWMSYQLFVLRGTDGQPAVLATISRDISARKAMEAALEKSQDRYRTLFEAIDNGFCVIEVLFDGASRPFDYRFLEINPAFEFQTGLRNALGKTMLELVPDIDDFWFQTYGQVVLTGEPTHVENYAAAMDRFFDVYAFRIGAPEDRQVAVLFTDISARKRGEIEREALLRQIEFERERLNVIFQNAPAFVAVFRGPKHTFELVNPAYYRLVGERGELVGRQVREALPEVEEQGFFALLDDVLGTGIPFEGRELRALLQRHRGAALEECFIDLLFHPLHEADGSISGVFVHGVDITDQVRARKAAEDANRVKDEFLATLSHELRTPLTAIMGWANILQDGILPEEEIRRGLMTIERNARAQSRLIEDILDVSRVITGKMRLEVQPVDLAGLIDEAVSTLTPAAQAKDIRLQRVLDVGASIVSGDPARLGQIVWNLLSNAIKFTPKGGRVQVRLERINSHVEIAVADNGAGISPEMLPHVFERFRQADSTSTRIYGGLGLGLAIVRHLVELHGGSVEAHSEGLDRGAEFVVKLPLVALRSLERRASELEPRVHPTGAAGAAPPQISPRLEGLHVLVVDDQQDTRELLYVVLESCGARVTLASSANEAFDKLQTLRPDALISDIGMPNEDGFSLIKRVRALPAQQGGQTPAAALTAFARVEDRVKILRCGFQIHLPKPIEPMELATVVANLAGRRDDT